MLHRLVGGNFIAHLDLGFPAVFIQIKRRARTDGRYASPVRKGLVRKALNRHQQCRNFGFPVLNPPDIAVNVGMFPPHKIHIGCSLCRHFGLLFLPLRVRTSSARQHNACRSRAEKSRQCRSLIAFRHINPRRLPFGFHNLAPALARHALRRSLKFLRRLVSRLMQKIHHFQALRRFLVQNRRAAEFRQPVGIFFRRRRRKVQHPCIMPGGFQRPCRVNNRIVFCFRPRLYRLGQLLRRNEPRHAVGNHILAPFKADGQHRFPRTPVLSFFPHFKIKQ